MENKKTEEIYNQTFGGLTLFHRDTNLSEFLISKYEVGQILNERGFTDMSHKGGGLATNFRYLIASANGKDVSSIMPDTAKFGHIMLKSNAFFKVLDIYKIGEKTQIFLLEIPETAVDFFAIATSNIEEDIIKKARESFDSKINSEPITELQAKEWKERTEFPIGMSEDGNLFYNSNKNVKNTNSNRKPWWKIW
jgi:hypothetical protein